MSEAATAFADDCEARADEKSIVVENGKAAESDQDVALATDDASGALEPIANVSEYEPDLAESSARLQQALVPTLADPPEPEQAGVAPVTPGTPDKPTADDVCIEEESVVIIDGEPNVEMQPASFNGVTPGKTTRADVLSTWSNPLESEVGGETLTYELENFPTIEISFDRDVVASIRVELAKPAKPQGLIAKLGLADFPPAVVTDEFGTPSSLSFPERGVTLNQRRATGAAMATDGGPSSKQARVNAVHEIVVRPIEAGPFLQRAKSCPQIQHSHRMADLQTAHKFDPSNAEVLCRLSELKLTASKATVAEKLAGKAVKLEPSNDECRLQWAKCLKQLARYDQAVEETRAVLEGTTATPIVRAAALEHMGQLAALGSKDVQLRSVPLHNKAIEVADRLTTSDDAAVRAAANEVLLGAHLAMAERIATGDWQNKDQVVGQWISRASALAEQMIANREGDVSLRLRVAVSALTAGGRLQPPLDPKLWVAEAEQAAADYEAAIDGDTAARDMLNWQLGLAYFYAAEIQHRRGQAELAIRYGELADATLTPLAPERAEMPDTRYALGRLYFQIGAVHAVHQKDHDMACQWYDRATELLLEPVPFTTLANPGQHGDALVSMGVSYWEVGKRERAYELTEAGAQLVDQGIAEGLLAAETLAVPQGNLNAMARALGKIEQPAPAQPSAGRTQMATRQRSTNNRNAAARPQGRMANRSTGDGSTQRR
jgi:tetratricopeptide (TPR) repeat protein